MDEILIFFAVAGAGLVGFTIAGVAGFGGGVIMLPILVWVLGVREAVPALTIAQLIGSVGRVPNTTLKRYALVIGASANLSLTTLIAKSPCLSNDFLTLLVAYIKRCFAKERYRFDDTLDKAIVEFIRARKFDESALEAMLNKYENPAKVLDTNWYAIKPMYERKYRELIRDDKKFTSINDIRLSIDSVMGAVHYLREIYRHRISKTRIISLDNNIHPSGASSKGMTSAKVSKKTESQETEDQDE